MSGLGDDCRHWGQAFVSRTSEGIEAVDEHAARAGVDCRGSCGRRIAATHPGGEGEALRMIVLAAMMQVGATQPGSEDEEIPVDRTGQAIEDANAFRLMILMYTVPIVLATVILQRFCRHFVRWNQTSVAASLDPEQRRRYLEEERERTYTLLCTAGFVVQTEKGVKLRIS